MSEQTKALVQDKQKVYFAHPINTYGTPLEAELLALIHETFTECRVVNPSDEIHRIVVNEMKRNDPNANVMGYFEGLVATCDAILVLPFLDGKWGAGVYREAEIALEHECDIWLIEPRTKTISLVTRPFSEDALSIDETRARVYHLPERTIRPYA